MKTKNYYVLLLATFAIVACTRDRLNIKVSEIEAKININRFDQELFDIDASEAPSHLEELYSSHSQFVDLYTQNILKIGPISDIEFNQYLNAFLSDTVIRKVADTVRVRFADFNSISKGLISGFKHYKYYFPQRNLPAIYTYVSGFNESLIIADELIGISLDKYLGNNCVFYQYLGIPKYKIENMIPDKIVPDLFYAWALTEYPKGDSVNNLLANMIYQGKLIYFTQAMNPELPDSLLIGYSAEKLRWCKYNEASMWSYLVEKKLIYSIERLDLQKYIGDAPFTNVFSEESPGRTGIWLGWQIVQSFMNNNPEVSLEELMKTNNAQKILSQSKYYPD